MTLELRTATPADATAAGRICHDAFKTIAEQHGFAPDFPSREVATRLLQALFSRRGVHALIAEVDGRIAGSNFLWEADPVAGIGPITVDPELQNAAIGRRLMQRALECAEQKGFKSVRLVQAAYHARSLSPTPSSASLPASRSPFCRALRSPPVSTAMKCAARAKATSYPPTRSVVACTAIRVRWNSATPSPKRAPP